MSAYMAHTRSVVSLKAESTERLGFLSAKLGANLARSIGDIETSKSISTREISPGIGSIAGKPA
jgi:hypothetical protein